ncbi:MAG: hypothetical protein ACJAVT_000397 [Yoonia sp.]|jgi:hypothetical protein
MRKTHGSNGVDGFAQLNLSNGTFDYLGNGWDEEYNPWLGYDLDAAVRYDLKNDLSVMFELQSFTTSNTTVPYVEYTIYSTAIAVIKPTDGFYVMGRVTNSHIAA